MAFANSEPSIEPQGSAVAEAVAEAVAVAPPPPALGIEILEAAVARCAAWCRAKEHGTSMGPAPYDDLLPLIRVFQSTRGHALYHVPRFMSLAALRTLLACFVRDATAGGLTAGATAAMIAVVAACRRGSGTTDDGDEDPSGGDIDLMIAAINDALARAAAPASRSALLLGLASYLTSASLHGAAPAATTDRITACVADAIGRALRDGDVAAAQSARAIASKRDEIAASGEAFV
jgi:hypothetical protein